MLIIDISGWLRFWVTKSFLLFPHSQIIYMNPTLPCNEQGKIIPTQFSCVQHLYFQSPLPAFISDFWSQCGSVNVQGCSNHFQSHPLQLHPLGLIKVINTFGQSLWSATFSAKSNARYLCFFMSMKQGLCESSLWHPRLSPHCSSSYSVWAFK